MFAMWRTDSSALLSFYKQDSLPQIYIWDGAVISQCHLRTAVDMLVQRGISFLMVEKL